MFTFTTPIINKKTVTSASFESDPPFEYGWAKSGSLALYCNTWGNTDNSLVVDVYWGSQQDGFIAIRSNIGWKQDTSLTTTISASGGTSTKVTAILDIPVIKSRYMKLVCTLSGTGKQVDVFGWFHGTQSGSGGSSSGSTVAIDQTTPGTTNNVSLSVSTGAGTSVLVKDDPSFGDGVSSGIAAIAPRVYNGTTYDRLRGDSTNGMFVNVKTSVLPTGAALDATLTGGTQQVQGNVASGATDSGNPIKIGGKFNTTQPTLTDGQRGDLQLDARANLRITPMFAAGTNAFAGLADNADAVAATSTTNRLAVLARGTVWNGSTWDRMPGDTTGVKVQAHAVTQSGTWTVQPGNTANTTAWLVNASLNPSSTALVTYSIHLTSNTTTTPTSSTAYISAIAISNEVIGTTSTVTIQDKSGTPLKLVNGFSTTTLTTTPTVINFQTPVKMTSGIDIITAGAVAATIDVWINYYQ